MDDPRDPEHGELRLLIDHLDSVQAEMITDDLRDLKIPAVLRRQIDTEMFEILVPEAFSQISHEVLGVTHLKQQGPASTAEILADMAAPSEPVPLDLMVEGAPFLRRCGIVGRWMFRVGIGVIAVVFAWMVLKVLGWC
jgi:hypothetical protein